MMAESTGHTSGVCKPYLKIEPYLKIALLDVSLQFLAAFDELLSQRLFFV
jgi:hypothetical protein